MKGFSCTCPNGFSLQEDYKTCIKEQSELETNELEIDNDDDEDNEECQPGFAFKAGECERIDVCSESKCSHLCHEKYESNEGYYCSCPKGSIFFHRTHILSLNSAFRALSLIF